MSRAGRTRSCTRDVAANRLQTARKFLETAELVATDRSAEPPPPAAANVAISNAVAAGIAAADAACCARLGERARGQSHHEALGLLEQVEPGGEAAANALRRLLGMKDASQYGIEHLGWAKVDHAIAQARSLVEFAAARLAD